MKKFMIIMVSLLLAFSLVGCGEDNTNSTATNTPGLEQGTPDTKPDSTTPPVDTSGAVKIEFKDTTVTAGEGVTVNGSIATITAAGTYEVSGKVNDGQLIVDADGLEIFLILNNVSLHCSNSAPLFVKKADHVYLSLADGSTNTLTDGSVYALEPGITEPDATLFSKADMTISGTGTLNVTANYNDGIANRDTLVIESGNINVDAVNHGIKGKDFLSIIGGTIKVVAGLDGIKSTNDTDATLGYLNISGGSIDIKAEDEAISAVTNVKISGGNVVIDTANNAIKAGLTVDISAGEVKITTDDKGLLCAEEKISSNANVTVNGSKLNSNY